MPRWDCRATALAASSSPVIPGRQHRDQDIQRLRINDRERLGRVDGLNNGVPQRLQHVDRRASDQDVILGQPALLGGVAAPATPFVCFHPIGPPRREVPQGVRPMPP